jgi:single-stranded DNA-binding protein
MKCHSFVEFLICCFSGHRVLVQGRIMYGTVEDKMGQKRHTTTIVADDVIRISS